jgi:D-beta-D-heptose 7-phosphate kinase/D-beta-D-heptose 1-phosphate adenosyltransferase
MSTIVIVTGGFDPLHSGHIAYLNAAKRLGDKLVVGLNSDAWLIRKKGYAFMPFVERQQVLGNLKSVDYTFDFDDTDGSACDAIEKMLSYFPFHDAIFANGGDRDAKNIPEMRLSGLHPARLRFAFGVGGENKMNSSSNILANFEAHVLRYYNDTHNTPKTKLAPGPTRRESPGRAEALETLRAHAIGKRQGVIRSAHITNAGYADGTPLHPAGRFGSGFNDYPVGSGPERQD